MCCLVPVCPSVPETLNLWGQSRSQVRSSGTGLHSVSTCWKKEHFMYIMYVCEVIRTRGRTTRSAFLLQHRHSQGANPIGWLCCHCPQWAPIERQPRVVTPSLMSPSVAATSRACCNICSIFLNLWILIKHVNRCVNLCLAFFFLAWFLLEVNENKSDIVWMFQVKKTATYPLNICRITFFFSTIRFVKLQMSSFELQ